MNTTITHLIKSIATRLAQRFDDPQLCTQYAWWLVETITQKTRTELLNSTNDSVTTAQQKMLDEQISQIVEHAMPLQYVIGTVPFLDLELMVQPPVLIPRPETEEWVAMLIKKLQPYKTSALKILDIGTGTGCIALALAYALPQATIIATDIAPENLILANHNALKNNIFNVTFVLSDVFESLKKYAPFDLIVSNPPYIGPEEATSLDPSVREWEDPRALFAQNSGYALIQAILEQAQKYIRTALLQKLTVPQLVFEIGHTQAQQTVALAEKNGYRTIQVWQDAGHKDRLIMIRIR